MKKKVLVAILMTMNDHSSRAKQEMFTELYVHCRGNKQELTMIDKFKRCYCPVDAIRWYTNPCFLHRLINNALRTDDVIDQYTYRYFLVDMLSEHSKGLSYFHRLLRTVEVNDENRPNIYFH